MKKSNDIGQQTPTLDKIEVITTAKSIEEIESSEQFGDDSVFNAEASFVRCSWLFSVASKVAVLSSCGVSVNML